MNTKNNLFSAFIVSVLLLSIISVSASDASELKMYNSMLPAPKYLLANAISSSQIDLSWEYKDGKYTFRVYRSSSAEGHYNLIGNTNSHSYSDTNLNASTTYYYKVQAQKRNNKQKIGAISQITNATTLSNNIPPACSDNCTQNDFIGADTSLVGWWKMDDINGGIVPDSSNHGNDATVRGATLAEGKSGGSLYFDGSDSLSLGSIGSHPNLNINDAITISAWVKLTKAPDFPYTIITSGSGISGANTPYYFGIEKDSFFGNNINLVFTRGSSLSGIIRVSVPMPEFTLSEWHHIAVTVDKSSPRNVRLYVDGIDFGGSSYSGLSSSIANQEVLIGNNDWDYSFNGYIDEVMLFSRALSASEIASL